MVRMLLIVIIAALLAAFAVYSNNNRPPVQTQATSTPTTTESTAGNPVAYQNDALHFTMMYPERAEKRNTFDGFLPLTRTSVVGFSLPKDLFQGTNLSEAGVFVGATSTPNIVDNCLQPAAASNEATSSVTTFNGTIWNVYRSTGAAAGNIYDETAYRTVHGKYCFEVVELLHSGTIANYPAGSVTQFDMAKFSDILESIVQTFSFQ